MHKRRCIKGLDAASEWGWEVYKKYVPAPPRGRRRRRTRTAAGAAWRRATPWGQCSDVDKSAGGDGLTRATGWTRRVFMIVTPCRPRRLASPWQWTAGRAASARWRGPPSRPRPRAAARATPLTTNEIRQVLLEPKGGGKMAPCAFLMQPAFSVGMQHGDVCACFWAHCHPEHPDLVCKIGTEKKKTV